MKLLHRLLPSIAITAQAGLLGALFLGSPSAQAHPYAAEVTNNAGTIQFYLNESADNVGVSFDNGAATNNLGSLSKGLHTFPLAGHTSYAIYVSKAGAGVPTPISVDSSNTLIYNAPRGLAVNTNPKTYRFGRVYGANSTPGGSTTGGVTSAFKGRGLYVMNADLSDGFGRGTNAIGTGAFVVDALSPNRLSVDTNDMVYVSDCSASNSTIYSFTPELTSSNQLLGVVGDAGVAAGVHGRISSAAVARGSLAGGDLVVWASDSSLGPNFNELESWPIGSGTTPYTGAPNLIVNLGLALYGVIAPNNLTQPPTDIDKAPDGKFFASFNRSTGSLAVPGLQVFDASGAPLWDSITYVNPAAGVGPDFCNIQQVPYPAGISSANNGAYLVRVSPDDKFVAVMGVDNHMSVFALTNGVPDAGSFFYFTNIPNTSNARDMAWDAADNIYGASSGQGFIRVWSLGLTTTAITKNDITGTNGSFQLITPDTKVSVVATTPVASQSPTVAGVFTITRTNASQNYSSPLTVTYSLSFFTNGVYTVSPSSASNSVTIAAGWSSTNITINPVVDSIPRPTTQVVLSLKGGNGYSTTIPFQDTVAIQNNGPQYVFISSVLKSSMYKGLTNDYTAVVLTRWGDTNAATYTVANYTYGGTAVSGLQFVPAPPVVFNPGDATVTNLITPLIDTTNYVGTKTVVFGLGTGSGYTVSPTNVTLSIIDNAYPPSTLIYQNPLTDPNDVTNWGVTAANNNPLTNSIDNNIDFGYDLTANNGLVSDNGLITLPPNGATNALRVTVNKNQPQGSGAAAGVNLYLTNLFLAGDYAVRFSMDIVQGANANYTTEGALYGINHTATDSNWWSGSGIAAGAIPNTWSSDGIWYWISADGGASAGDYIEYTGLGGTNGNTGWTQLGTASRSSFGSVFTSPVPYSTTGGSGLAANSSPQNAYYGTGYTNSWADVEIKTVHKVVTMSINKKVIYTYTNTTSFTNGYLMLGYNDPFSSVGSPDAAVYYSGLTVVTIGSPTITTQPVSVVSGVTSNVTFSAVVAFPSTSYFTNYQWSLNGTPIAGATNSTYSFTVVPASFGTYSLSVSDGNTTVVSSNATLTALPPAIVTPPANVIAAVTGSAKFTSLAQTFSGTTNYQWYTNSVSIGGATSSTLTLSGLTTLSFALNYTVSASDGFTTVTSTPAVHLIAASSPAITSPALASGKFTLSFGSQVGPSYVVDYKTNLTQAAWLPISTNAGTGGTITVTNAGTNAQGYYIIQLK